jgi:hypothetical protein
MKITIQQLDAFYSYSPETNQSQVIYEIDLGDKKYEIFIRSNILPKQFGLEAIVPLALLAAMRLKRPIHVKGALSRSFLDGVKKVMFIYESSFDCFSSVEITADHIYEANAESGQRKASFFSGGVDSFFTLLKSPEKLTDLVVIHGFDIDLRDADRREKVHKMTSEVAAQMGMRLIEIESNFSKIIKDYGLWVEHGHGLALVSVARALAGEISQIKIPGSFTINEQKPWGSSLEVDPKFSDERLQIIHDASDVERIGKIESIIKYPITLKYLRVCGDIKYDGMYNCCRCEKCIRTMCSLYALNVLDKSEAFVKPLTPDVIVNTMLRNPTAKKFALENLSLLKRYRPGDTDFIDAIQRQINRPIWMANFQFRIRKKVRHVKEKLQRLRKLLQLS